MAMFSPESWRYITKRRIKQREQAQNEVRKRPRRYLPGLFLELCAQDTGDLLHPHEVTSRYERSPAASGAVTSHVCAGYQDAHIYHVESQTGDAGNAALNQSPDYLNRSLAIWC